MVKTKIIIFMLLLQCCNKPQRPDDIVESHNQKPTLSEITVVKNKQYAYVEKNLMQRLKLKEITIAEMVAMELKNAANSYSNYFDRSIPNCGECSDLELLLILERANNGKLFFSEMGTSQAPYIDVPSYIIGNKMVGNRLREAYAKYEENFEKKHPWWWMCSDEEKLERIKRAIETNTPYPEYSGSRGELDYRLGKAIAGYEMWFKRPPPEQDRSDGKWFVRLENAIEMESPLLTEGEEVTLKTEYFKRFRRSITDTECSLVKVSLARRIDEKPNPQISVIRTATGAIALYQPFAGRSNDIVSINPNPTEMMLNLEEWLDFTNAFHKYTDRWGKTDCSVPWDEFLPDDYWELKFFFANADTMMSRHTILADRCSLDWKGLVKFIRVIEKKTKNKGIKKSSIKISVGQKRIGIKKDMLSGKQALMVARASISAGENFIVGVKQDSTVVMAIKMMPARSYIRIFDGLRTWNNITSVSGRYYHVVGLKSDNTVIAIGVNKNGQLNVVSWKNIVAVSGGGGHTLGLRSTGTVMATGLNYDGQCNVTTWNNIVAISAGGFHTLGLRSDGTVASTGSNSSDQCNVGDWKDIVAISAGRYHSIGLKSNGTVVTVGRDWDGMCSKTRSWGNIIAIAAGDFHTVGLRSDGTVLAVGDNEYDKCNVSDWNNIVAIAASAYHTVGLKADGTAVATGEVPAEAVSNWSGLDVVGVNSLK